MKPNKNKNLALKEMQMLFRNSKLGSARWSEEQIAENIWHALNNGASWMDRITAQEVKTILDAPGPATCAEQKQIRKVMRRLGWKKIRWWQDRRYLRGYKRPEYCPL